jgi:chorismate mutase
MPDAALERWQLLKGARTARCVQTPHPLGVELRVLLDADDLRRSEVFRAPAAADAAAAAWRGAFEQKGWRPAPPRFARAALARALALTRAVQARVPGDTAMGHVLSYRLKVMGEALEVALDRGVSLDDAARERRVVEAMRELGRAERGPDGQALVAPILDALN